MKLLSYFLVLVLAISATCSAQRVGPEVPPMAGDFRGRIVDGSTGNPLEGTVVVASWEIWFISNIPLVANKHDLSHVTETVTDRDGRFVVKDLGRGGPPLGWQEEPSAYPRFMFFKPGYAPRYVNQWVWLYPTQVDRFGRHLVPPAVADRYPREEGLVLALYEYAKDPMRGPNHQPSELDYIRGARGFLIENIRTVERDSLTGATDWVIREQINAFTVVDQEIYRLTGKREEWSLPILRAIDDAKRASRRSRRTCAPAPASSRKAPDGR